MCSSLKSDFYVNISTKFSLKFQICCLCPYIECFLHGLIHIVSTKTSLRWVLRDPIVKSSGLPS